MQKNSDACAAIGQKIAALRRKEGISQEEFAYRLGVSRKTVSLWELEKRVPKSDTLELICHEFGVDIGYFFGGEEKTERTGDGETASVRDVEADPRERILKRYRIVLLVFWLSVAALVTVFIFLVALYLYNGANDAGTTVYEVNGFQLAFILCAVAALFILSLVSYYVVKQILYRKNGTPR